jgi:hypothetical protein
MYNRSIIWISEKKTHLKRKCCAVILNENLNIHWKSVKSYGFIVMPPGLSSPNSAEDEMG